MADLPARLTCTVRRANLCPLQALLAKELLPLTKLHRQLALAKARHFRPTLNTALPTTILRFLSTARILENSKEQEKQEN